MAFRIYEYRHAGTLGIAVSKTFKFRWGIGVFPLIVLAPHTQSVAQTVRSQVIPVTQLCLGRMYGLRAAAEA